MAQADILAPGMNRALPQGPLRFALDVHVAVDHFVLALDAGGKVAGDADLCFYNQPEILDAAVRINGPDIHIDTDLLPERVARLVVCAAPAMEGVTFGGLPPLRLVLDQAHDPEIALDLKNRGMREAALIMAEIYRRNGAWRVRCVSQGYVAGLEALLTAYGVELEAGPEEKPATAPCGDDAVAVPQTVLPAPGDGMGLLSGLTADRLTRVGQVSPGSTRVVLALDLSGSMDENYRSGRLDPALRAVTAMAHTLSPSGTAELMFFGRNLHEHGPIDMESCLDANALALRRYLLESRTLYAGMMARIREMATDGNGPVLAVIVADGGPDDLDRAEWELSASRDAPVFWSFLGLECGTEVLDRRRFGFMDRLRRDPVPNAGVRLLRADAPVGPEALIEEISEQLRRMAPVAQSPSPT